MKYTRHKLTYASPDQPALVRLKFDGSNRALYDVLDRAARRRDCSRQYLIFEILNREFEIKTPTEGVDASVGARLGDHFARDDRGDEGAVSARRTYIAQVNNSAKGV